MVRAHVNVANFQVRVFGIVPRDGIVSRGVGANDLGAGLVRGFLEGLVARLCVFRSWRKAVARPPDTYRPVVNVVNVILVRAQGGGVLAKVIFDPTIWDGHTVVKLISTPERQVPPFKDNSSRGGEYVTYSLGGSAHVRTFMLDIGAGSVGGFEDAQVARSSCLVVEIGRTVAVCVSVFSVAQTGRSSWDEA